MELKEVMKFKKCVLLLYIMGAFLLLAGCGCKHEWTEATCTEPKTCSLCGETEGKPLGHTWEEATCTEPKTCAVCGITSGRANGHDWENATASSPKKCKVCGLTETAEVAQEREETEAGSEEENSELEMSDVDVDAALPKFEFDVNGLMTRLESAKDKLPDGTEKDTYYWESGFELEETTLINLCSRDESNYPTHASLMIISDAETKLAETVVVFLPADVSEGQNEVEAFTVAMTWVTLAVDESLPLDEANVLDGVKTRELDEIGTYRSNTVHGISYMLSVTSDNGEAPFQYMFTIEPGENTTETEMKESPEAFADSQQNDSTTNHLDEVKQGYQDALKSAKEAGENQDYEYHLIYCKAVYEQSFLDDGDVHPGNAELLFGKDLSNDEIAQRTADLLTYVVDEDGDELSALMRKFQTLDAVSGTIEKDQVDIEVTDINLLLDELGIQPAILGRILAMLDVYDYSWMSNDPEGNKILKFTDAGFTFQWHSVGGYYTLDLN